MDGPIDSNLKILGELRMMENPKLNKNKSPLDSQQYATHSKRRPSMHFLGTTTNMESSGLRPAQAQGVTFCSRCTGKSFWI